MKRMIPAANTSTLVPTQGFLAWISGAMYDSVPSLVRSNPFPSFPTVGAANPKSAIFKLKAESNSKFSGFKSLWVTPFQCTQSNPSISCLKQNLAIFSSNLPVVATQSNNSPPVASSSTMQITFSFFPFSFSTTPSLLYSIKLTMLGWESQVMVTTSVITSSRNLASRLVLFFFKILMAKCLFVSVSKPNFTFELAPEPRVFNKVYFPSFEGIFNIARYLRL